MGGQCGLVGGSLGSWWVSGFVSGLLDSWCAWVYAGFVGDLVVMVC